MKKRSPKCAFHLTLKGLSMSELSLDKSELFSECNANMTIFSQKHSKTAKSTNLDG